MKTVRDLGSELEIGRVEPRRGDIIEREKGQLPLMVDSEVGYFSYKY